MLRYQLASVVDLSNLLTGVSFTIYGHAGNILFYVILSSFLVLQELCRTSAGNVEWYPIRRTEHSTFMGP